MGKISAGGNSRSARIVKSAGFARGVGMRKFPSFNRARRKYSIKSLIKKIISVKRQDLDY